MLLVLREKVQLRRERPRERTHIPGEGVYMSATLIEEGLDHANLHVVLSSKECSHMAIWFVTE